MSWSLLLKFSTVPDSSTAFAETLLPWNHDRKWLQAFETSIVANLMPIDTGLFALFDCRRNSFPERAGWDDHCASLCGLSRVRMTPVNHERTCLDRKPDFLRGDVQIVDEGIYQPHSMSRRSELYAYGFALSVGLATGFLRDQTGKISIAGVLTTGLFLIVGLVLSFGAWMEARTRITVSTQTLAFKNPLRRISVPWDSVTRIHARWVRERWKIVVLGEDGRLIFSTEFLEHKPGLVSPGPDLINGPMLAAILRNHAKLSEPSRGEDGWMCEKMEAKGASGDML